MTKKILTTPIKDEDLADIKAGAILLPAVMWRTVA